MSDQSTMPGMILIHKQYWKYKAKSLDHEGQGYWRLHGCTAAAGLKGTCYLIKFELSSIKGIHQN